MRFHQGVFEKVEARDSHREGWSQSFDRLEDYLATVGKFGAKARFSAIAVVSAGLPAAREAGRWVAGYGRLSDHSSSGGVSIVVATTMKTAAA